jgi:GNAT superfamily N-acetyltransferase
MTAATVRFATADDAKVILRFIRGLAEYEREPDAVKATAAELRAQMQSASPPFECLIADDGRTPIGFALFYRSYSTWIGQPALFLEDFFVEQEYRGRGAGLALIKRLAQIARERGYSRLEWRVLDWNEPAHRFYRSLGAFPIDEWTVWRVEGDALERLSNGGAEITHARSRG